MVCEAIAETYGLKKTGQKWRGPCPVHGGTGEAFVLAEREDGRPLVHCFAGCDFRDIVKELRARSLWPEDDKPVGPPPKKVEWARWCIRIFEEAKATGEPLGKQDWYDYRKAQGILSDAKEAGRA